MRADSSKTFFQLNIIFVTLLTWMGCESALFVSRVFIIQQARLHTCWVILILCMAHTKNPKPTHQEESDNLAAWFLGHLHVRSDKPGDPGIRHLYSSHSSLGASSLLLSNGSILSNQQSSSRMDTRLHSRGFVLHVNHNSPAGGV